MGGGALWDVGSYPVSFIRWIAGEPEQVFGWQTLGDTGVDAAFAGLLRCGNGVLGVLDCGLRQQFRVQAEIVGTEGTLVLERPYVISSESRLRLHRLHRGHEEEEIALPQADAYRCGVEALTTAVLDGAALPHPLASSRANVDTLATLYESARRGVALPIAET